MVKFFKANIKMLLVFSLLSGGLGAAAYFFLPTKYYASGSIFVKRVIYPYSETHFTYEGYYGQQAAVSYTNSVIGLIESEDIHAQALQKIGISVTEKSLRVVDRKIKTIKSGPQIINLVTKEKSPEKTEELWSAVADSTLETAEALKTGGDPYINVAKVSDRPIVKEGYRNLPLFSFLGIGLGLLFSTSVLSVKNYFHKKKK